MELRFDTPILDIGTGTGTDIIAANAVSYEARLNQTIPGIVLETASGTFGTKETYTVNLLEYDADSGAFNVTEMSDCNDITYIPSGNL